MQNRLKSFFSKDKILITVPITYAILLIVQIALYLIGGWGSLIISSNIGQIISLGCLIALSMSFFGHEKNVMKGMLGALLGVALFENLSWKCSYLTEGKDILAKYGDFSTIYLINDILLALLFLFLFVNHFVIYSDHHSNPSKVFSNQISVLLIVILDFMQTLISIFTMDGTLAGITNNIANSLFHVGAVCLMTEVVCVETKIDAFKAARDQQKMS